MSGIFFGLYIHTCKYLPKWQQRWEFPATPFVEYSKEDEKWAVPTRFGRYVDTDEPYILMIDESYINKINSPRFWSYY